MVYCGISAVEIRDLQDSGPILNYHRHYGDWPRVLIYEDQIYFVAANVRKSREIEDVFKVHLLALKTIAPDKINPLPEDELLFLIQWDAEKYRKSL